jgi:hypothetical protein
MNSSAHEKQPSIGIKTRKRTRATAANHGPPRAVYAWFKPFPNEIALALGTSEVLFAPGSPGRSGLSPSQCHETPPEKQEGGLHRRLPGVGRLQVR